jgi:pyridoxine 4-dehydrogenase
VGLLIPGTRSIAHLEENLGAGEVALSPEAIARLDAATTPGADPFAHGIERFIEQG